MVKDDLNTIESKLIADFNPDVCVHLVIPNLSICKENLNDSINLET